MVAAKLQKYMGGTKSCEGGSTIGPWNAFQRIVCYVYLFSFVLKPKQEIIKSTTNTGEFNSKF